MSQDSSNIKFFSVLKLNDLPPLPSPSKWLQEILTSINFADPMYHPCKLKSRYENRKRKSKINGFIAFRSFYSRAIKSPKPQQEISASLAVAWKLEPNRKVWNYYALLYNETAKDEEFLYWLYRSLGIIDDASCSVKQISKVNDTYFLSKIEDVFLQ